MELKKIFINQLVGEEKEREDNGKFTQDTQDFRMDQGDPLKIGL